MNVLDLFSGIGGFSLGLERAGMRTVAFCEIDPFCRRVLKKHWPDVPIYRDVRELTGDRLRADGIAVDLICGGFPCQDVSIAGGGARKGLDGERSGLWSEYARLIRQIRPRFVIVENVPGLLSLGVGTVLGDLAEIGYDAEWQLISAAALGASHIRDRFWLVGYPNDEGQPISPFDDEASGMQGLLADAYRFPWQQGRPGDAEEGQGRRDLDRGGFRPHVADADDARCFEQWWAIPIREKLLASECDGWWPPEPDVGRVAHGVPDRVDRIGALGNAVVPQIPEILGRAIMRSILGGREHEA